jgi:hypothetical protein
VILTKFLKIAMPHVVLDWQKISKTILEKAFFFIFWCFYLCSVLVLINFKISTSEVKIFLLEIGHTGVLLKKRILC